MVIYFFELLTTKKKQINLTVENWIFVKNSVYFVFLNYN